MAAAKKERAQGETNRSSAQSSTGTPRVITVIEYKPASSKPAGSHRSATQSKIGTQSSGAGKTG
jgi:hypothetical protein